MQVASSLQVSMESAAQKQQLNIFNIEDIEN